MRDSLLSPTAPPLRSMAPQKQCPNPGCLRKFDTKEALLQHHVTTHGGAKAISASVRGYILCKHCECSGSIRNFKSNDALRAHMQASHQKSGSARTPA